MLLEVRKYGFTLLTVLLSADGFLYAKVSPEKGQMLGIYLALMVLIVGLFRVDRYHAMFVRGAVARAHTLEHDLGLGLSRKISAYAEGTATWGVWLFVSFCLANFFLATGTTVDFGCWEQFQSSVSNNWPYLTAIAVVAAVVTIYIYVYHRNTKHQDSQSAGSR